MTEHTPGPWSVGLYHDVWIPDQRNRIYAPGRSAEEQEANARLIAAAPVQREALICAESTLGETIAALENGENLHDICEGLRAAQSIVEAAIQSGRE